MKHAKARELLEDYALGLLDRGRARRLEVHLARCPLCAGEAGALAETVAHLSLLAPAAEPPPELRLRLLQRLPSEPHPAQREARPPLWWGRALAGMAAALLLALALAGFTAARLWRLEARQGDLARSLEEARLQREALEGQVRAISATLEEERNRTYQLTGLYRSSLAVAYMVTVPGNASIPLQGTLQAPTADGVLVVHPNGTMAALLVSGLPDPGPGMAYQVWLLRGDRWDGAGLFRPDESGWGQLLIRAPLPLSSYQRIGITLEPAEGSPYPTSPPFLLGFLRN